MKNGERPTGIIRTILSLEGDTVGRTRYERSLKLLQADRIPAIYIAMPQMPQTEVLHFYLLIQGEIKVRFNLAGYEEGRAIECWDQQIRQPKWWAICTAPVSFPPEPLKRRGFQGFRYTEELW